MATTQLPPDPIGLAQNLASPADFLASPLVTVNHVRQIVLLSVFWEAFVQSTAEEATTPPSGVRSEHFGEAPEPTVLHAGFSGRDFLSLYLVGDDLLSRCWARACDFARDFGAPQVGLNHLLLAATLIREAEPILERVCGNLVQLNQELGSRCANRCLAEQPESNAQYAADKQLKVLLCRTAALAADQEAPHLTLSLLLKAVEQHDPPLPVLELLDRLAAKKVAENLAAREQLEAVGLVSSKVDHVVQKLDGLAGLISTASEGSISARLDSISTGVYYGQRQTAQLFDLLADSQPLSSFGTLPSPVLKVASAAQIATLAAQIQAVPAEIAKLIAANVDGVPADQKPLVTPEQPPASEVQWPEAEPSVTSTAGTPSSKPPQKPGWIKRILRQAS